MTIWLLAILLIASLAAVGYQQGGIRMGISFFGILLAFLLAGLAGKIFVPLLGLAGVKNPIYLWALPPLFGFILISALIKIGAFIVHQKVDVYYKYKAGDLRLALWERINHRLGACVGVLNAVAYLVLIAFVIHAFSYWTVQLATADTDPKTLRLLNRLGRDLQSTGMNRVAKAIDSLDQSFYDTADLAGLLYQNSLLEARLLRYPGFLALGEKAEFQALGQDGEFRDLRLRAAPLSEVMEQSSAKAIFANPELLRQVWDTVRPDLADLTRFLHEGKSEKYQDKILGRWLFDANSTVLAYRRAKPNAPGAEVARIRVYLRERYSKSSIVAAPSKLVTLKNFPDNTPVPAGQPPSTQVRTYTGTWEADGLEDFAFALEGGTDKRTAKFEGVHLILSGEPTPVAFRKED